MGPGKLIEKMISNRLQYDMIKYDLVLPNQFGGVRQRSTEDDLTHLVCAGWAKGVKTSVVAFDIAQFFPSINHKMLLAILCIQGFSPLLLKFFKSYLVEWFTIYKWNDFLLQPMQADTGVGQGSALSPVLLALFVAPVMRLYIIRAEQQGLKTTLLLYVDDGTVAAQSKSLHLNNDTLQKAYVILFTLFTAVGLVLDSTIRLSYSTLTGPGHWKTQVWTWDMPRTQGTLHSRPRYFGDT